MPSLFNRRSRSMSTTRTTTPASSPAHLAAAQAFLANQSSQSNLSASAAAAALRTMSPTPRPVDQVQTKRMLNRQASNSSVASAPRGRSRGSVQRRSSAGSMTERTFRSPSPGQQTSQGAVVGVGRGAPPVPPVPQSYTEDLPRLPPQSHRRSASVETPPRLSSLQTARTPAKPSPLNTNTSATSAATVAARRSASNQQAPEMKRSDSQDSRNSINFSYPRGSRPNSPPPRSPLASTHELIPSPVTANGLSPAEVARIQNNLTQTAATPVKKKKKRVDPSAVEGSHLQSGTMGAKPIVTPLESLPADHESPTPAQPVKKTKKKASLTGQSTHFPDSHDPVTAAGTGSPSDSDAGSDAAQDRRAQRAAGVLMKHPSVVREDWEGEQEENEKSSPVEPAVPPAEQPSSVAAVNTQTKKPAAAANMSRKIEDPSNTPRPSSGVHSAVTVSANRDDSTSKALSPPSIGSQNTRGVSISPSRSARFSDRLASDLSTGRKHEPLGRSVSPAKSALKNSSAASDASPSDPKFPHRRASSVTPSEASDVSVEGMPGRKKSARVSFEGSVDTKDSLSDTRTSKEVTKKGWFGGGRAKTSSSSLSTEEEAEEGMKPRPALPSFGSVRRNERSASPNAKPSDKTPAATKSPSSSETSSIADPPTMDTSVSSDHALGSLLAKESQRNDSSVYTSKGREPPTAKTASTEAAHDESDSESAYSEDEQPFQAARAASQQLGKTVSSEGALLGRHEDIPSIAVQPATPALDDSTAKGAWAFDVPGGFPASGTSSDVSVSDASDKQTASTHHSTDTASSATIPVQDYSQPANREISINTPAQLLTPIVEEDSDNDSVYSDAAEEMDGDGFGSINAIIESPVSPPTQRIFAPQDSPSIKADQRRPDEAENSTTWGDTQAHWSGLAQRSRDVGSQSSVETPPPTSVPATSVAAPKPEVRAPTVTKKVTAQPPAPAATVPQTVRAPAPKKQLKTTTVSQTPQQQPPPTTVVATKRISPPKAQGHLRSSMRGAPEPVAAQPKPRPLSYAGPSSPPRTAAQKQSTPTAASSQPLLRTFSNDSDSDSSFKKARRSKRPTDGQYTMRRSMRSGPTEPARQTVARPQSPPTNNRPTSPMGMKTLRTSMRNSVDMGSPTLRPQLESKRSSSLFSRNRTAKSPTRPATALPAKSKSRIVDSDDEDVSRPARFQSRFGDSSDEDEPTTFRPVRGIPRRKDDGDSTDLADSSDEEARKSKAAATKKLTIVPPPPSQDIASPPLSPTTAKKRGLWSRLRGKKKDDEVTPNAPNTILRREDAKEDASTDKQESKDAKNLGFNSAAERDALIEQTRLKLEGSKQQPPQSPTVRPQSPGGKLQRRMTPQRVFSDSYLPPPRIPAAVEERPQTSDGVEEVNRPGLGSRQPTTDQLNGDGAAYGKSGKKKKFGRLRRVFGLTD